MKHILCPIDGSDPAKRRAVMAAVMAVKMQAKLTILHIREYVIGRGDVYDSSTSEESEKYLAEAEMIASTGACKDLDTKSLKARDPAHAILDFAEKSDADHIVVGGAGKGMMKSFLIGLVSFEVVRKARCLATVVH